MYEPIHFPCCRFSLEHLTSSHLPEAAGTVGGLATSASAAVMRDDDVAYLESVTAPSLRLNHSELWHKFSAIGTEMVITKSGRHVYALCVYKSPEIIALVFSHNFTIKVFRAYLRHSGEWIEPRVASVICCFLKAK